MIELYACNTSNGQRGAVMLAEAELAFHTNILNLKAGEHKTPEVRKINPVGAVPVIIDPDGPGGELEAEARDAAARAAQTRAPKRPGPTDVGADRRNLSLYCREDRAVSAKGPAKPFHRLPIFFAGDVRCGAL